MSEDVALFHRGNEAIEKMQIRATDRRPSNFNDVRRGGSRSWDPRHCELLLYLCPSNRELSSRPPAALAAPAFAGRRRNLFAINRSFHAGHCSARTMGLAFGPGNLPGFRESLKVAKILDNGLFRVATDQRFPHAREFTHAKI